MLACCTPPVSVHEGAHFVAVAQMVAGAVEGEFGVCERGLRLNRKPCSVRHTLLGVGVVGVVRGDQRQPELFREVAQHRQGGLLVGVAVLHHLDVHVLAADRGNQLVQVLAGTAHLEIMLVPGRRIVCFGGAQGGHCAGDRAEHRPADAAGEDHQPVAVLSEQVIVDEFRPAVGVLG